MVVALLVLLIAPSPGRGQGAGTPTGTGVDSEIVPSVAQNQTCNNTTESPTVRALNLTLNSTPIHLNDSFWGTTISPRAQILPDEADVINATPAQLILWPGAGAGDTYDPLTNTIYSAGGLDEGAPPTNESQFVRFCEAIDCRAIFQVPGEINDPQLAAAIVTYTEVNLSFHPAYWEIGNEPEDWKHFDLPWSLWDSCSTCTPTDTDYADEVQNYTIAMQQANNDTAFRDTPLRIIGIPAAARSKVPPLWNWIEVMVDVNGPRIAGVAFHEYPASGSSSGRNPTVPSLQQFYEALTNETAGLPARIVNTTSAIHYALEQACPSTCSSIPIFVTEIGTALSHKPFGRTYSAYYAGALAMTAEITEAMTLNVTNADVFGSVFNTNNSWLNLQGIPRPEYVAFSQVLTHLGSVAYGAEFSNGTDPPDPGLVYLNPTMDLNQTVFGIATQSPGALDRNDLLVVNTNVTDSACFEPRFHDYVAGSPVEAWYWNGTVTQLPYTTRKGTFLTNNVTAPSAPTPIFFPRGLPAHWELPPQSLVLFETFNAPAAPVRFTETGLPAGTTWFLKTGISAELTATNSSNVTLLAPFGTFPLSTPTVYLPEIANDTRFVPETGTGSYTVTAGGTAVPIVFVRQWRLNIAPSSNLAGTLSPDPQWADANVPLTLSARPAYGYAISQWDETEQLTDGVNVTHPKGGNFTFDGTEYTNVSNVSRWASFTNVTGGVLNETVWPTGALTERVEFAPGYPVTFVERGLPAGTHWSVTLHSMWNDTQTTTTYLSINRSVGPSSWETTWDNVSTERSELQEINSGAGSLTDSLTFVELNRTYGFSVSNVTGYRQVPVGANLTVGGRPLTVYVNFTADTPPGHTWPVTFVETGLPVGTSWTVAVRGATLDSTGSSVVLEGSSSLTNGSYGYTATSANPDYRAHPLSDGFNVSGPGAIVRVSFGPVLYEAVWKESGLGNVPWVVDVSGQPVNDSGAWTVDRLFNGTYQYTIPDASTFSPSPNSGSFSISGAGYNVTVQFVPWTHNVTFREQGLPAQSSWTVRLGTQLCPSTVADAVSCAEPGGTYSFNVTGPTGFVATPSHGVVVINATSLTISIAFTPLGPPVDPPIGTLVVPALLSACVIALVAWATFVLVAGRKRRRSGANP